MFGNSLRGGLAMRRPLSFFAVLLCATLSAHAQGAKVTSTPNSIAFGSQHVGETTQLLSYNAGANPESVVTGDFNGDGRLDIAVVNGAGNNISVLFGNGNGTFQSPVNYADSLGPTFIVVADLRGNGHLDLVVADYESGVSVFLNNGDGTFQKAANYSTGYAGVALAVGDINGDGIPDVVVANYKGDTVSVLLGKGDGTLLKSTTYKAGGWAYSVALGDFNGDGKIDIAVTLQSSGGGHIGVLLGNGNGTFQSLIKSSTAAGPTSLVAYDFNGDGKLDLAVGSEGNTFTGNTVCVLLGKGNGTFQPPVQYTVGVEPTTVVAADFNGDGKEDLAVMSYGGADFSILLGNGNGTFQPAVSYVSALLTYSIAVGDFTGNGDLDLVSAGPYSPGNVFLGNGNGTFQDYFVLLTNTGTVGTYLEYSIAGADAKDFAVQQSCGYLGPSGVCTLETSFTPKATGQRTATLQVTDKAGNLLTSMALTGTGE